MAFIGRILSTCDIVVSHVQAGLGGVAGGKVAMSFKSWTLETRLLNASDVHRRVQPIYSHTPVSLQRLGLLARNAFWGKSVRGEIGFVQTSASLWRALDVFPTSKV